MKFDARPPVFGRGQTPEAAAESFPTPFIGKAAARRTAMLSQAADVLSTLPGPNETLHAIMTGRYDLMHLVAVLIGKLGGCKAVRIATLSFNGKNLAEIVGLLDNQAVDRFTLLCSAFFRDHNRELWQECRDDFHDRGCQAAASRSHCKVVTLETRDGRKFSLEGSANLRTNSNREQFALTQDDALHDWHAAWIDEQVITHATEENAKTSDA